MGEGDADQVVGGTQEDYYRSLYHQCSKDLASLHQRYDVLSADCMIAHRWFARRFGTIMNGRDFAIKCPMADESMLNMLQRVERLCDDTVAVTDAMREFLKAAFGDVYSTRST